MSIAKLKNAPLKEVIFELFWDCATDSAGMRIDEGFGLAQGMFYDKLRGEFPLHKKLLPDHLPLSVFGAPIHQYWKGPMKWPVIQHGQGMVAINEVEEGYVWESSFKPCIHTTLQRLADSYQETLAFNRCRLQYIDVWELGNQHATTFVQENLRTQLITGYQAPGALDGFNVQLNFRLENDTQMVLQIATGESNQSGTPSLILTILVEKTGNMTQEQVLAWLDAAHDHTSAMFKNMLTPSFYASLDQ